MQIVLHVHSIIILWTIVYYSNLTNYVSRDLIVSLSKKSNLSYLCLASLAFCLLYGIMCAYNVYYDTIWLICSMYVLTPNIYLHIA